MDEQQWHDLFEDVAAKLKHENLTRQQQHAELARMVAAERERWRGLVREALDADEGDHVLGKGLADRMRAALNA